MSEDNGWGWYGFRLLLDLVFGRGIRLEELILLISMLSMFSLRVYEFSDLSQSYMVEVRLDYCL